MGKRVRCCEPTAIADLSLQGAKRFLNTIEVATKKTSTLGLKPTPGYANASPEGAICRATKVAPNTEASTEAPETTTKGFRTEVKKPSMKKWKKGNHWVLSGTKFATPRAQPAPWATPIAPRRSGGRRIAGGRKRIVARGWELAGGREVAGKRVVAGGWELVGGREVAAGGRKGCGNEGGMKKLNFDGRGEGEGGVYGPLTEDQSGLPFNKLVGPTARNVARRGAMGVAQGYGLGVANLQPSYAKQKSAKRGPRGRDTNQGNAITSPRKSKRVPPTPA
ncbi:hypothetical protein H6P81_016433 [Aristolochia fimbriata]|uniref:Uncharacterized protein n=1 Tax=Aristolochia fimbriata TaxID=158543 RepID=A0AAV7E8Q7_ARIFI|nr:hypothetical protein H6P81_016433 [Aristolochia fimbriata]